MFVLMFVYRQTFGSVSDDYLFVFVASIAAAVSSRYATILLCLQSVTIETLVCRAFHVDAIFFARGPGAGICSSTRRYKLVNVETMTASLVTKRF